MKIKQQLIQEIEKSPDFIAEEVLNFLLFLKFRIQQKTTENKKATSAESSSENFLEFIDEISSQIPPEEWEKIPSDLSYNLDNYLYGAAKTEE
ncbi:MAG: hypothetical protein AB4080_11225 [Trichodesmium sp.]